MEVFKFYPSQAADSTMLTLTQNILSLDSRLKPIEIDVKTVV